MFEPLREAEIAQIVRLQLDKVVKMLAENEVQLSVTDAAVQAIAKEGYDPEFGARPVKRVIQRDVLNELSKRIIAEQVDKSKPIVVDAIDGAIRFSN